MSDDLKRMKKEPNPSFYNFCKIINKAIDTISSKEKLKQVLAIPLYTNALYLTADMVVSALLAIVFWAIVARFYSASDVGFATAIISAVTLLATVSYLGFDASLIYFLPRSARPRELINTSFTLCGLASLLLGVLFLLGLPLWSPALQFMAKNIAFASTFIIFLVLWTLSRLADHVFIAQRQAKFVFFKDSIFSLLRIPVAIFLSLLFYRFGPVGACALAIAIAVAISLLTFLPRLLRDYKPLPELRIALVKGIWKYSGASYLASLFYSAYYWIPPLLVVNVLGAEANAYFYIAFTMASVLFIVPSAIASSLFAEASHSKEELHQNTVRSLKFTFLTLVPGVILFLIAGKWLLLLFGQNYSANALGLLWVLSLSSLPLGINHIYFSIFRVTGRLRELIGGWGFTVLGVLVGSYLIMPITGIVGVGYAWLGTHTLVTLYIVLAQRARSAKKGKPPSSGI